MRMPKNDTVLREESSSIKQLGQDQKLGMPYGTPRTVPEQNYSYAGIIEALSGAPFDVKFISFDDILKDKDILKDIDVIINVGDGDTAHTGGAVWENAVISAAFVNLSTGAVDLSVSGNRQDTSIRDIICSLLI